MMNLPLFCPQCGLSFNFLVLDMGPHRLNAGEKLSINVYIVVVITIIIFSLSCWSCFDSDNNDVVFVV